MLARIYHDLKTVADQEGHSIYTTSSLIALGAVRTGIKMGNVHIFDYYRQALDTISSGGLRRYVRRVTRPYRRMVVHHLNPRHVSHTERFLASRREERGPGKDDP